MAVARKIIVDVFSDPVMNLSTLTRRVHMHVDASKMLDVIEQLVSHLTRYCGSFADR